MEQRTDTTGAIEIALANAEKGIVSIPCHPGTKVPCVRWKRWQQEMPPEWLLRQWFQGTRNNIAVITNDLVVFDVDDRKKADLVIEQCGETPYWLRSPRGGEHFGYRKRKGCVVGNHVKIKGLDIDIRAENGLAMIPPSRTADGAYEWLAEGLDGISGLDDLPVARIGWTRERKRRQVSRVFDGLTDLDFMAFRASEWLKTVEGAVSGQGGHNATFRVACRLVHRPPIGFGLDFEAALRLMLTIFNPRCEPEWTERELTHKVRDALKIRK